MRQAAALVLALLAAGCDRQAPAPTSAGRYMLGEPYAMGGVWSYPREDFGLEEGGVAAVLPRGRPGQRTANGEAYDPDRLVAAHRTLQLPAIISVWNLENGREIKVRVNDRGPAQPGRVVGLSPRAAQLLGIPDNGAAQVRIRVETGPSQALAGALPNAERPAIAVAAAPRATVETEALPPLAGTREAGGRVAPIRATARPVADVRPEPPPDPLPETVTSRPAQPGRLVVEAGSFFRRDLAQRQAARIPGVRPRVEPFGGGRQPQYRVVTGSFPDIAAADRAVGAVLRAGLPEVRLLVE
ncbi:RlpA-like double-psi beta-barrel domain-containing protein [Belnapia sp. F-4-1]|uniref:RlpA-like double-psi beta-barrel domain-containing protein n=1 Tax=Belnapia sp. F-4-1 TaxID=1545443 RepID=UPI00068CF912|nr:RlpA-like double-psi beta-barrel domain-containing protein [Belnapia sp. F-4-1]